MKFYPLTIEMDDNDTWFVTSPDFPEVTTFGESIGDALHRGRMAIEEALAARIKDQQNLPPPYNDEDCGVHAVQLRTLTFLKAGLYMVCRAKGISRAELSRRLNWNRESVERLFRIGHDSKLDQLEDAFEAIGIGLDVEPAQDVWQEAA